MAQAIAHLSNRAVRPPMGPIYAPDLAASIANALAALDDENQRALLLRERHGLTYDQIGVRMGISPAAVLERIAAARREILRQIS